MSYILDALKKSEQERRQGNVPNLQTVHIPVAIESSPARWPYIVIALLLLSLAFILGMLRPWDSTSPVPTTSMSADDIQRTAPVAVTAMANNHQQLASVQPSAAENYTPSTRTPPTEPSVPNISSVAPVEQVEPPTLDIDSAPHLFEMPTMVQQAIPEMTFAGHVFSSDVSQRSVIINGHSMSEGEVVIDGLSVEQITHNGIVFDYNGQLFRMDVLQDWSFD